MACAARRSILPASGWSVVFLPLLAVVLLFFTAPLAATTDTAGATQPAQDMPADEVDDWDMDWEDPAPAPGFKTGAGSSEVPAATEPSAPSADDSESTPAPAAEADDWDWDWEETDTGPAYKTDSGRLDPGAARMPKVPRVGETAEPDFSASPKSGHELFADVPGFGVIPSIKDKGMHPCSNCHTWAKSNLTPRRLKVPHDNFLLQHGLHGKGEFWCFTCHHLDGAGGLRTLEGERLSFDDAYILCAQCHPGETRDWSFGAHGKRVDNWQGNRRILNCTACHYQHRPNIKPRKAVPPPPVRRGLVRNERKPHVEAPLWEKIGARNRETGSPVHP